MAGGVVGVGTDPLRDQAASLLHTAAALADTVKAGGWSPLAAADDVLDSIDILVQALGTLGPAVVDGLVPVRRVTAALQSRLATAVKDATAPVPR
ncbi:hypothetical protein ACIA5F_30830, partial [Streptomyces sp. NPDC051567]